MRIGNRNFDLEKHTYVMGILNVTPDSFSDGGKHKTVENALQHAEELIRDGVDVIDIGGESTRPNYVPIDDQEEIERILPILEEIKKRWDVPLSIDTYKSKVAEAVLDEGADMINDIWGLKYDDKMASIIKRYEVPICLMHNRKDKDYNNFLQDVILDLKESIQMAMEAGIKQNKLILDPGVGFAKDYEQNLCVIANLECFQEMGLPILLGTSRKSVIGTTLGLPVAEREEGTLATTVVAAMAGCGFVRVHDVKQNVRAIKMVETILQRKET